MFFLGLFAVMDKKTMMKKVELKDCRVCKSHQEGQLFLIERIFSLFFLPVFKWKRRYGVHCIRCGSWYWIHKDKAATLMKEEAPAIGYWDMLEDKMTRGGICQSCGQRVLASFRYCPYCRQTLE